MLAIVSAAVLVPAAVGLKVTVKVSLPLAAILAAVGCTTVKSAAFVPDTAT